MVALDSDDVKRIFFQLKTIVDKQKDLLTALDSEMGDGDLGITMTRAFTVASEEAEKSGELVPGKLLMKLGMVIAKTAPSTMGTLVATGFMKGGKAVEQFNNLGAEELAVFFDAFVQGIMDRGKSAPGSKTIVDSLYPAAEAFRAAVNEEQSMQQAIESAQIAALDGLAASTQMKAQHGRAAYYQEQTIGKQDGGATVGTYIIHGFFQAILNSSADQ